MRYSADHRRLRSFLLLTAVSLLTLISAFADAASDVKVDAFFLKDLPGDYAKLETLFTLYKGGGANTVIISLPTKNKDIDKDVLANAVFLSHLRGMKLLVIVPTRKNDAVLNEHPDWEDMKYDLESGTLQPTGRLDLYQPLVKERLVSMFKDIAAYSVDGILMGEDFIYGDTEGMSPTALDAFEKKFGAPLVTGSAIAKVGGDERAPIIEEYGDSYWNWADLRRAMLIDLLQSVVKASRAVNRSVKFGITIPIAGFGTANEALANYSYDMVDFRKQGIDYYWIAVPHREIRANRDLDYKKTMEVMMRMVKSTTIMVKDPVRSIIGIQTTTVSGKVLPLSEIEEVMMRVRQAGDSGIAFMVVPETQLPAALTRKLFKHK